MFNPLLTTSLHLALHQNRNPLPGEDWTNSLGMSFRWIEPLALWAGATETRKRDFREFVKQTKRDMSGGIFAVTPEGVKRAPLSWENPGFEQTEDHPVVGVSWQDAMDFCVWLTAAERGDGHLPAALRYELPATNLFFQLAGNRKYPWGDQPAEIQGNYSGQEADTEGWPSKYWPVIQWIKNDTFHRTAPAVSLQTNELGLYHVGGNVAEWCVEGVVSGRSWADGESPHADRANGYPGLEYLATRRVQAVTPQERHDRYGFRLVIRKGAFSPTSQ